MSECGPDDESFQRRLRDWQASQHDSRDTRLDTLHAAQQWIQQTDHHLSCTMLQRTKLYADGECRPLSDSCTCGRDAILQRLQHELQR